MSLSITRVAKRSFQLTRLGLVNAYLVPEDDGLTLIDTGIGGAAADLMAASQSAGAPIRRIALTHAHADHVGSVDALAGRLTSPANPAGTVQLAASGRSVPLLRQPPDKALEAGEPAGAVKGSLPGIQTEVSYRFSAGELFGSLRVLETPGHIPGHISFLDERDGTLYAGDALVAVGRLSVSGYAPWYFPLPNFATWNKALALESARKLLDYPIERFACGHGPVREGGAPLLRETIERTKG